MLSDKSTLLSKTRAHLDISTDLEDQPKMEYATEEDERDIELANEVDLNYSINPSSSEFGSLTDGELELNEIVSLADATCSEIELDQSEDSRAYQWQIESQETQNNSLVQSLDETNHQCILCALENNIIKDHPFIQIYKKQLAKEIRKQLRKKEREKSESSFSHTLEIQFKPDENRVSTPYPELNNSILSYLSD
jgi:hypothetical protein